MFGLNDDLAALFILPHGLKASGGDSIWDASTPKHSYKAWVSMLDTFFVCFSIMIYLIDLSILLALRICNS